MWTKSSATNDWRTGRDGSYPSAVSAGRSIALLGAALSVTIGAVAIAGWAFGLPVLTRFYASRSAMQPITALCAILAGAGILRTNGTQAGRLSSNALAGVIVIAAVQTLVEYGFGIDLGTDDLFFPASVKNQAIPYPYPGRMAAPTAAAYLLVGSGLLLAPVRGRLAGLLLSACATAVLVLVIVALLGYFYMLAPLTGVLGFTRCPFRPPWRSAARPSACWRFAPMADGYGFLSAPRSARPLPAGCCPSL